MLLKTAKSTKVLKMLSFAPHNTHPSLRVFITIIMFVLGDFFFWHFYRGKSKTASI